ncbi:MAG: LacI family transcriptional regulator [Lachnospiraceae bacterium]|nr:LacI family transcriptional regulator [Lachnospiraceae bacterium]
MAGIRDIAERAGVSTATVSNVLNNKHNVGEETRKRVLRIAEELGYSMPSEGSSKAGNHTILFHFSDFDTLYYLDILHGISDYAYAREYSLLISSDREPEKYADPQVSCGCIAMDHRCGDSTLMRIADRGCPVVVLDRELDYPGIKSIVVNNYAAERQLMEGLVREGYESYAFLGGLDTPDNRERYRAFSEVLKENGIAFKRTDYYEGDWKENSGVQAARLLLLSERMPEVLVCANDMMALGAIRRFREEGIRVPADIAVCGFDDIIISRYTRLTTVTVPDYERGYLACQSLIELVEGRGSHETLRIGARVKWRDSHKKGFVK